MRLWIIVATVALAGCQNAAPPPPSPIAPTQARPAPQAERRAPAAPDKSPPARPAPTPAERPPSAPPARAPVERPPAAPTPPEAPELVMGPFSCERVCAKQLICATGGPVPGASGLGEACRKGCEATVEKGGEPARALQAFHRCARAACGSALAACVTTQLKTATEAKLPETRAPEEETFSCAAACEVQATCTNIEATKQFLQACTSACQSMIEQENKQALTAFRAIYACRHHKCRSPEWSRCLADRISPNR